MSIDEDPNREAKALYEHFKNLLLGSELSEEEKTRLAREILKITNQELEGTKNGNM